MTISRRRSPARLVAARHLRRAVQGWLLPGRGSQHEAPAVLLHLGLGQRLEGASEALAQELAPFGIKVLIVEPGAFRTGFSARALRHMPVMDVYQDAVGPMRAFAHAMDNTQEGDPRKAAEAIEAALDATTTPLRLQLGADAVAAVRAHAETLLADLAGWERIANDTRVGASQEIRP